MIRMVQIGIDHPHARAYCGTLWALRDRIEVVGFLAREDDPTTTMDGVFADVPIFRSLDDLLTATRPDAAQVMLRNNEMGPVLARLANEGIHLWAEKPEARAAADLQPAREAINRKGLVFTAGYQSRFYGTTKYARALVREGLLGPLTFAHMTTATTTVQIRNPRGPQGYLFDQAISGGGIFHWLGCHMIDLLLSIVGERPAAVTAFTGTVGVESVPVEDVAAAVLRFPSGWLASLNYGYLLPTREAPPFGDDDPEPALYGQQGWVRWSNGSGEARAYSADPRWADSPWRQARFTTPSAEGYGHAALLAMCNFLDAIAGVAEPMYRIEEAIAVLEVIEAVYESARTGQAIALGTVR
jgi:predicted dehydrogenase